ncbi:LysM peptidoglycan-binding domain-containing protein, partial [uncultured Alsobacter sp.]|uniref:LysM peptidoglycan-binding domain-containing protein n=1 Tax=uncultured Alsobacter sp. TaxID=1748258 RepID=UPI0025FC4B4C
PALAGSTPPGTAPQATVASSTPPTLVQGADALVPEIRSTMVSRGDSLWRISRRVYGKGVRYTVIYEANQQQIRDPRRIYPGQMFVLPAEKP